jgi:hypothetical protein
VYPLRGLNTNGKNIAIGVYTEADNTPVADFYTAQAGSSTFSAVKLDPGNNAIPTFLVVPLCELC